MNKDFDSGCTSGKTLGHQGGNSTGGMSENLRVLFCSNLDFGMNFHELEMLTRQYGKIEKIRLKSGDNETTLDSYIVYKSSSSAVKAHSCLNDHEVNGLVLKTRLFNILNLKNDPFDYYPEDPRYSVPTVVRKAPTPVWFVVNYKDGKENFLRASETLNKALNGIPPDNMKRYGKSILIKAKNTIQAKLLQGFKPSESSNVGSVSPHRSFNCIKGVVYSKDLWELSEEEILHRSPPTVYQVKKLKGTNHVIMLQFSTENLPEYINFGDHVRIRVRRFKPSPKQCRNCLNYGHFNEHCQEKQRCFRCSGHHETDVCSNEIFCLFCEESHYPYSNACSRRKFEKEVIETAEVERISIGSAKQKIMGANRNESSTYANIIKKMKVTPFSKPMRKVSKGNTPIALTCGSDESSVKHAPTSSFKEDASTSSRDNTENSITPQVEGTVELPDIMETQGLQKPSDHSKDNNRMGDKKKKPTKPGNVIDEDGFQLPPEKKRCRPVSPPSTHAHIDITNSFSKLQELPPKKQAVVGKVIEPANSTSSCRPKVKSTMPDMKRTGSAESIRSCVSAADDVDVSDTVEKEPNFTNEQEMTLDTKASRLVKPGMQEKIQSSNIPLYKPKRLEYHFKSFKNTSQTQTRSNRAGQKKFS